MKGARWRARGSYGRLLHRTIKRLDLKLEKESDHGKLISLAKTIGYLASVQREFIKDEENSFLEKRIEDLENRIGI